MEILVIVLGLLFLLSLVACAVLIRQKSRITSELASLQIEEARTNAQLEAITQKAQDLEAQNVKLAEESLQKNKAQEAEKSKLVFENSQLGAKAAELAERVKSLSEKISDFDTFSAKVFEAARSKFESSNKLQLDSLLSPLKADLKVFGKRMEEMNAESELKRGSLEGQIKALGELNANLGKEAKNLTQALKGQNKSAGCWGEMVLERLLESCGLKEHFTYIREDSHTQEGGRLRPDFVVKLPDQRNIIVDSKVSLLHYEKYTSALDISEKSAALKQFLDSVRTHIKGLAKKKYENIEGLTNPDFVVMFLPLESAFALAVSEDPEILKFAYENKVALASPSTMLAILRTIETLWRTEKQERNTVEIARQGGALYDKVSVFLSKFEKIGKSLKIIAGDYEEARITLSEGKGNVLSSAEKLRKLGANAKKQIESKLLNNSEDE